MTENSRDWSGMDFNIDKMEYQNAIHIIVAMERTSSSLPPSFFLLCCADGDEQIEATGKTGAEDGRGARSLCGTSS